MSLQDMLSRESIFDFTSFKGTGFPLRFEEIRKLKEQDGPEIQVHGSSKLIQTLLKNDLIDELRLKIYPVTLGKGKRLFAEGVIPAGFRLMESKTSPKGVIVANYVRAGEVKTGSFAQ